ncbi:MAG TPA: TolC family protein, partial [Leptospiraceae bacterium]|nr:TolC family protein [Leptospiraceae bacterium]
MKILYAVFMAFVCSLAAEEKPRVKERLTLKTALDRVQKNFPLLAAVLQDVRIAQGDLLSSEGAFDGRIGSSGTSSTGYYNNQRMDVLIEQPTMYNGTSLFAGYRLGTGKFPPYYGERETNKYGEFRAGARVPVWRDREIDRGRAGIRQAKIGVRLADLTVEQQKLEIYRNACFRYWDWAAAAEKLKIAKSNYEIAKERQKQIVGRVKAGDLPKIEEKDNERILLQRESQFLSAEQNFQIASNEL